MNAFSVYVLALSAVAAGHWWGGFGWPCAAFLFFPTFGLTSGVINNEGERITGNGLLLAGYLLSQTMMVQLMAKYHRLFFGPSSGGSTWQILYAIFFSLAVFAILCGLCTLGAKIVGPWQLPAKVHRLVARFVIALAYTVALAAVIAEICLFDRFVYSLNRLVKAGLAIGAVALYVLSLKRLFTAKAEVGKSGRRRPAKERPELMMSERPSTTFDDVAGMESVKEQVRLRLVEPVRNAALARRYGLKVGGGMMLYGPPGTGKTMLARAVAGELKLPFFIITAADVFGKYVGESERNIRQIFAEIRKNPLSVVFIDELEALFPSRSNDVHESTRKVISVLLQEMDGIDQTKNPILLLGATNVPWLVDEAFLRPGRFDVKVFVGLPDVAARRQMLIGHLYSCEIPHEEALTGYLAERTEGFSGADIKGLWQRMQQVAYTRRVRSFDRRLADEVLSEFKPTAIGDTMTRIRQWEREHA